MNNNFDKYLNFPPFFTLQPHQKTQELQMTKWGEILKDYFLKNKISKIEDYEIYNLEIFKNESISRSLSRDFISQLFIFLAKIGTVEKSGSKFLFFSRNLQEFSEDIENYVRKIGAENAIFSLHELIFDSKNQTFEKVDEQIILKALNILQGKGKCLVFEGKDGEKGVKFNL